MGLAFIPMFFVKHGEPAPITNLKPVEDIAEEPKE
jgi:hypothetical protein